MADLARRATRWVGTFPYILTQIPNLYDHSFPRYGQITFLTFRRPTTLTFDLKFWKYLSVTVYPYVICMPSFIMIGWEMAEILHFEILRKHGQTHKQTHKHTHKQTNERALLECILCKIGLTDWVIYLVDWRWQRSRTQSIGPNDSNEKCAMSRVLFGINIAAIQKIRDLDLLHLTLTFFFLDLWPWYLTLGLICYYLDAFRKTLQKCIVLTSRDAKTAPHL